MKEIRECPIEGGGVFFFYLFESCVCIDLRGRETGVSEQRLYGAYVCSVVEHRGGKGVKCYKITEKTGNVIGAKAVDDTREVMLITTEGIIIRLACRDISTLGRITSGVKLINLDEGVKVATVSKVRKNPSDENGSEASDENGYSEENIATDTQEDAVDIQDKSIDRLLDAAEKDQQQ